MMTKAQATKAGKALLKRMHGYGWKLRVHENIGWHYCVETSRLSVNILTTQSLPDSPP